MILAVVLVRAGTMNNEVVGGASLGSVDERPKPIRRAIAAVTMAASTGMRRDLRCEAAVLIRVI